MSGHSGSGAIEHGAKHNMSADHPPNNNVLSGRNDNMITHGASRGAWPEPRREIIHTNMHIFNSSGTRHLITKNEAFLLFFFFAALPHIWFRTLQGSTAGVFFYATEDGKNYWMFHVMKNFAATVGLSELNFGASGVPIGCEHYQSRCHQIFIKSSIVRKKGGLGQNSEHGLKWREHTYLV